MGLGFTVIGVRHLVDARILSKSSPQAGEEFGKVDSPENHHWLVNEGGTVMGAAPTVRGCSACPPCATATTSAKEKSSIKMEAVPTRSEIP